MLVTTKVLSVDFKKRHLTRVDSFENQFEETDRAEGYYDVYRNHEYVTPPTSFSGAFGSLILFSIVAILFIVISRL